MARVRFAVLAALSPAWVVLACSSGSSSSAPNPLDRLVNDDQLDASNPPMMMAADDAAAAPPPGDSSNPYPVYDGAVVLVVCAPTDGGKSKRDAGGSGDPDAAGAADPDAAGASADPDAAGGSAGPYPADSDGGACQALPAACVSTPTCECLLTALASSIPCPYPHCGDDKGFYVYCP